MNILVISPHPDDDVLGAGGTIRKLVDLGDQVHVLYLTSGELGCPGKAPSEVVPIREKEANECAHILGINTRTFFHIPDGQVKDDDPTRLRVNAIIRELAIERLYAPHINEAHPDHKAAGQLARGHFIPIDFYEIWTPLQTPTTVVDITSRITTKRSAIRAHKSQISSNPFCEAILSLNNYRGLMHGPNVMYGEAFEQHR